MSSGGTMGGGMGGGQQSSPFGGFGGQQSKPFGGYGGYGQQSSPFSGMQQQQNAYQQAQQGLGPMQGGSMGFGGMQQQQNAYQQAQQGLGPMQGGRMGSGFMPGGSPQSRSFGDGMIASTMGNLGDAVSSAQNQVAGQGAANAHLKNYFNPSSQNLSQQQWMNEYLNFRGSNNGTAALAPENRHADISMDEMSAAARMYDGMKARGQNYQWRAPTPAGMQEYWVNGRPVMSQAGVDPDIARLKAIGADTSRYEQQLADFSARNDAMTAMLKRGMQQPGLLQQNPSPQQAGLLGGPPRW